MCIPAWFPAAFTSLKLGAELFLMHVFFVQHKITNCCEFKTTLKANESPICDRIMDEGTLGLEGAVFDISAGPIAEMVLLSV